MNHTDTAEFEFRFAANGPVASLGRAPASDPLQTRSSAPSWRSPSLVGSRLSANPRCADPLPDGSTNQNPAGIGFWALVREDYRTHDSCWTSEGFWAVFVHRFGNWRMSVRTPVLRFPLTLFYGTARKLTHWVCGIKLDYTVKLGRRVKIEHFGGMILGARSIGDDVVIRQNTTLGIRNRSDLNAKPIIGSRVEIGAGAVVIGNVQIGDDCFIGANCVVSFDVPSGAIVRPPRAEVSFSRVACTAEPAFDRRRDMPAHVPLRQVENRR